MEILAIFFVIALVGLFVTIGLIIAGALNFGKDGKRVLAMIEPPKNSAIEIFNTGKGIAAKGQIRYNGYIKHGTRIYVAVKESADEVGAAAKTVNVDEAKSTFEKATATLGTAKEALKVAKVLMELFEKAK
jgi:hypothetical protein